MREHTHAFYTNDFIYTATVHKLILQAMFGYGSCDRCVGVYLSSLRLRTRFFFYHPWAHRINNTHIYTDDVNIDNKTISMRILLTAWWENKHEEDGVLDQISIRSRFLDAFCGLDDFTSSSISWPSSESMDFDYRAWMWYQ